MQNFTPIGSFMGFQSHTNLALFSKSGLNCKVDFLIAVFDFQKLCCNANIVVIHIDLFFSCFIYSFLFKLCLIHRDTVMLE